MRRRLGCLAPSGIMAAAATLVLVLIVSLVFGGRLFSPGRLNAQAGTLPLGDVRSHAETGGRCSACHAAFWSGETMTDRCLHCHVGIRTQLQDPASLHGALSRGANDLPCRDCHTEHRGAGALLTIVDPETFPHEATGYALEGHQEVSDGQVLSCSDCHGTPLTRFDPAACLECHSEMEGAYMRAHVDAFGSTCLGCHDGLDTYGQRFDHDQATFRLLGRHITVACLQCHRGARSPADLKATPAECLPCHRSDDFHNGQFGQDCAECHTPEDWGQATFDHTQTAFALLGRHLDVECRDCHVTGVYPGAPQDCFSCHEDDDNHNGQFGQDCAECHMPEGWDQATFDHDQTAFSLLGRHQDANCHDCHVTGVYQSTPQDCYSCHELDDAHGGQFGQDCAECHTPEGWDRATFDHDQTAFSLLGRHQDVECRDCHVTGVYQGTPQDCYSCHEADDAHGGELDQDCAECHTPETWEQVTFDHSRAAFALLGRHLDVDCQDCHAGGEYIGTPQDCFSCHEVDDAHDGQFGQDCAGCHTPEGWDRATFDHGQTAFALLGRHVDANCLGCHVGGTFRGTPQDCFSCHEVDDAHDGRFGQDCATCHTPEDWDQATFDHSQTAFELIGRHQSVDCHSCHVDNVSKGTPLDCYSCHQEDDEHSGQFGQLCAQCHTPEGWELATFDHSQTAFALVGRHQSVNCLGCHVNNVFGGIPKDCYACHQGDDQHGGQFGQSCGQCHTAEGWEQATFDHSQTAFALTGRHQSVNCQSCHASNVFKGTPKDCYACHQGDDQHGGQFGQSCGQCHTAEGWEQATFDHNQTAFALTGAHVSVACLQCHVGNVFKGTPTDCAACHGEPAYHAGLLGTACAECHSTAAWTPAQYGQPHGFPMYHGEGGTSSCRTCHPSQLTGYTCYGCHDPGEIQEEHLDEGIPNFQNCMQCHPTGED